MNNFNNNKRGSLCLPQIRGKKGITDILVYVVFLFIFAVIIVTLKVFVSDFATSVNGTEFDKGNVTQKLNENFVSVWDTIFIFFAVAIPVLMAFLATQLNVSPVFVIPAAILLMLSVLALGMLSESWGMFQADPTTGAIVQDFSMMNFVFNNFPTFIIGMVILTLVFLYGKRFLG